MSNNRDQKSESKKKQNPGYSNDQLGENSGTGRLMREQEKKEKKKT